MPDLLELIYPLGQILSLLALAAGALMSLMASDSLRELFRAGRPKGGAQAVRHANQRPNLIDRPVHDR